MTLLPLMLLPVAVACAVVVVRGWPVKRARAGARAPDAGRRALADLSHELRTPLNGVLAATYLLQGTSLTADQREYLDMAATAAEALRALVHDVLDFSTMESAGPRLELSVFSMRAVLAGVLRRFTGAADAKGLRLDGAVADDVPDGLVGDAGRVRQVLVNLLGNAVKFTDQGEIRVRVTAMARRGREVTVQASVTDTGVGVPLESRRAIFEPFAQGAGGAARGGAGLGLAISARLVDAMGGRIRVDSEPGRGSTFHFTATFGVSGDEAAAPAPGWIIGLHTLVAQTPSAPRQTLVATLEAAGATVTVADTGQQALEAAARAAAAGAPFRAAMLAIELLSPSAFDVAVGLRVGGFDGTIVVLARPTARRGDRGRFDAMGLRTLTRPFDATDVWSALAPEGAVAPSSPAPAVPRAHRPLRILLGEDDEVNRLLTRRLLVEWGHDVVVAESGTAALAALEDDRFDLAVIDVRLPGMDGLEVAAAVRRREIDRDEHLPIVAVTALAMPGDRERCLAAGMDAYLTKPLVGDTLFGTIEELAAAPVFDRDALRRRAGGDAALEAKIVRLFLTHAPEMLDDVRRALERRHAEDAVVATHKLSGAIANFSGAAPLRAARRLERLTRLGDFAAATAAYGLVAAEVERLVRALPTVPGAGA